MGRVIADFHHSLNHRGYPWQSPQIGFEAVRARALAECLLEALELARGQLWFAPGPPGCGQSGFATSLPGVVPATYTLPTNFEFTSYLRLRELATSKEPGRSLTTVFEAEEIASWW